MSSWLESFKLDPEMLMDVAGRIHRLKMYPYFDICHYLLMSSTVRDDLASGASLFSRKHPLSCWFSSMLMCFAGNFLAYFLLGEPPVAVFRRQDDILLATIVWYFVFYSPFDIVYKVSRFLPVKVVLSCMKEVQRAHKVHQGVIHATKVYPHAYLVSILIGTVKGAGSGIIRTFEQLIRGVWVPAQNEMLRPSFATKACLAASILYVLEKHDFYYINGPHELIHLGVVSFFVYFKLSSVLFAIHDPFAPFENLFCAIFMGGIWDAFSRAIAASRENCTNKLQENDGISTDPKKDQ